MIDKGHHGSPLADTVDAEPEDDPEFALIQMKSEVLDTVDEAVRRFDAGADGSCRDLVGRGFEPRLPVRLPSDLCRHTRARTG